MNRERSWSRVDGIDLLRGLSILFVMMNHVHLRLRMNKVPYADALPNQLVHLLAWNGQRGVQIFFAVSGFLITSTTIRRWGTLSNVNLREFYLLRFARIAPLLLLLLAVLSTLHLLHVNDFVISAQRAGLGQALLAALTFRINVLEATRGYLPGNWDILWSLSVEEMFYLFFPLLCRFFGRGKFLLAILAIFVLLGPPGRTTFTAGNAVWQEYSYLGRMDAIALGCLTAILLAHRKIRRRTIAASVAAGAVLLVASLGFSIQLRQLGIGDGLEMTLLAIGACLIMIAAAETGWESPGFLAPLRWLGQRSYEVYLTHMFVVFGALHVFLAFGTPIAGVPLFFIGVIVAAGLLGELVARFYSEPLNRKLRERWGDGPRKLGSVMEAAVQT